MAPSQDITHGAQEPCSNHLDCTSAAGGSAWAFFPGTTLESPLQEDDMKTDTDDWADFQAALQWRPDPVEVDLLRAQRKESGADIISMLVAIYGSKELFINEYRCPPSARLKATTVRCGCQVA